MGAEAREPLRQVLASDLEPKKRVATLLFLGMTGDREVVPEILHSIEEGTVDLQGLPRSIGIIVRLADRRAVPLLVRLLDDTRELPDQNEGTVGELAAVALARITGRDAHSEPVPLGSTLIGAARWLERTMKRVLPRGGSLTLEEAAQTWKPWWEKHKEDYLDPEKAPGPELGPTSSVSPGDLSFMPDWVLRPAGVYEDPSKADGNLVLVAVGAGEKSPSDIMRRTWAESQMRDGMSRVLTGNGKRLIETCIRSAPENAAILAEMPPDRIEMQARRASNECVAGARILNTYIDPKTGTLYFQGQLPLDDAFRAAFKEHLAAALKTLLADQPQATIDTALAAIDSALETWLEEEAAGAPPVP
ncbi:MAG: hypothetical protein AB1486_19730 [Planctomycetota bacterium]